MESNELSQFSQLYDAMRNSEYSYESNIEETLISFGKLNSGVTFNGKLMRKSGMLNISKTFTYALKGQSLIEYDLIGNGRVRSRTFPLQGAKLKLLENEKKHSFELILHNGKSYVFQALSSIEKDSWIYYLLTTVSGYSVEISQIEELPTFETLEKVNDAMLVLDENLDIQIANSSACQIFGLDFEDIAGQCVDKLFSKPLTVEAGVCTEVEGRNFETQTEFVSSVLLARLPERHFLLTISALTNYKPKRLSSLKSDVCRY